MATAEQRQAAEEDARRIEVRVGFATASGVGAGVAALGLLAWLKGTTSWFDPVDDGSVWVASTMAMGYLLVALQLVSSLLVHEHLMARLEGRAWRGGVLVLWLLRAAITACVLTAVWWSRPDDSAHRWAWRIPGHGTPDWETAGAFLLGAELVLVVLLLLQWRVHGSVRLGEELTVKPARELVEGEAYAGRSVEPARLAAIGASGGGIRAAAFVLGGHQAVQDRAADLGVTEPADEPHVFAVSGGSYMATAMALRRKYATDGTPRPPEEVTAWDTTYATGSAELQWLRRHTRYLFEPGARLRDGVLTLLLGAAVNIFLACVALRFVAWVSTQLSTLLGVVEVTRKQKETDLIGSGEVIDVTLRVADVKLRLLGLPLLCLVLVGVLTAVAWYAATRFDRADGSQEQAGRLLSIAAKGRPVLLLLAAAWLLLTFVLPGATAGATKLAAGNQPTTRVASALTGLGLVDEHVCRAALLRNLARAEVQADQLARINPGAEQTVSGGACGTELDITRTAVPAADAPDDVRVTGEPITTDTLEAMRDYVDTTGRSTRTRVAGIGLLLTVVASLLRRGSAPAAASTGRFAAIRRKLLTWLPLAIMAALAAYLAVLWSGGLLVHMDGPGDGHYLLVTAVLTAVASTVAFVVDANVTSMHRYYRSSLSSGFAVGVDGEGADARARELAADRVYRFSDLGDAPGSPRLHVVATLNTQEPGEAPTLRRGYPVVFSGAGVATYRYRDSEPVPMRAYEEYAGPGRVSIMATVGISGAAVSPIMGRYNEQMAPYRMLLALFNLRLGTWTLNPAHTPGDSRTSGAGRGLFGFLWLTTKPGLVQMGLEAAGKSSADQRWVYLSDGGHLDNTALVECVRHTGSAGRVLVLDASNDPVDSWAAAGDAIAVVKADLDVDLRRVELAVSGESLPWARRYRGTGTHTGLDVLVVKAVRVDPDDEAWWPRLPPNVQSFLLGHPDFPRSSTGRQKFGDLEFEAYRALGHVATHSAIATARWDSEGEGAVHTDVLEERAVVADHD